MINNKKNLTQFLNIDKKTSIVDIHKKNGIRPDYDIYIGRRVNGTEFTKDSKWAKRRGESFPEYEKRIRKTLYDDLDELKGNILGGWCLNTEKTTPLRCHAQILLKLLKEKNKMSKKKPKIILMITGSRTIKDIDFIFSCLNNTYKELKFDSIVEGEAEGVDVISKLWARVHKINIIKRPAKWNIHGNRAGLIRNVEMAEICTDGIGIWDGISTGTAHGISQLKKRNKLYKIFYYKS